MKKKLRLFDWGGIVMANTQESRQIVSSKGLHFTDNPIIAASEKKMLRTAFF